jgi:integrating conjugative element protein (TIGR03757 family)
LTTALINFKGTRHASIPFQVRAGLANPRPGRGAAGSPGRFQPGHLRRRRGGRHRQPSPGQGGEQLIELDEAPRIEAELSAALPADPGQATAIVKRRLSQGGADLQRRIATAYQGVADAWSLGITTIPAVVVDQRYVVYGEPDVARAIARIEQHRRAEP